MARKKENAVIISQQMIAQDIYSMWIKTDAAKEAVTWTVYIHVYE